MMRRSERKANVRVLPKLPEMKAVWEHGWSEYPDIIYVPMSDGTTVRYVRDVAQPRPMLGKALDRFSAACGYPAKADGGASSQDK